MTIIPTNPDSEDLTDVDSDLASLETLSHDKASQDEAEITWSQPEMTEIVVGVMDKINELVLDPLLTNASKEFQQVVHKVRKSMHIGTVLRDVESALLFGAQVSGLYSHTRILR